MSYWVIMSYWKQFTHIGAQERASQVQNISCECESSGTFIKVDQRFNFSDYFMLGHRRLERFISQVDGLFSQQWLPNIIWQNEPVLWTISSTPLAHKLPLNFTGVHLNVCALRQVARDAEDSDRQVPFDALRIPPGVPASQLGAIHFLSIYSFWFLFLIIYV